ncbi:MAG: TIGR00341 family protein [Bacteroidetes bacterium]|nr:TIGR00341 family protein [Bacteroidota bacterium]
MERPLLQIISAGKIYLKSKFNLDDDKEAEETTIAEIKKGVVFRGTNLWILVFAILIASIGLNVNSTAVVIGAMLISPLMGPIMGIGMGAGINDLELIKKAIRNLVTAALASIITSALYFAITPLHEAQSELLARTTPTIWDVLIAFFGGLAGIIAGSRKEKSNAIPGVAIATALMPPLCTAGYGLANGNWYYFLGAFYLFFINGVFISLAAFLVVRMLKFQRKKFENPLVEKRMSSYITVFVLATMIPSVWLAYKLVRETFYDQNARKFIKTEFNFKDTRVIGQEFLHADDSNIVDVTLYGKPLSKDVIENIKSKMQAYGLGESYLRIHQGYEDNSATENLKEFEKQLSQNMKFEMLEELYSKNEEALKSKEERIRTLENALLQQKLKTVNFPIQDLENEMLIHYPELEKLSIGNMATNTGDTICHAYIQYKKPIKDSEINRMTAWLKTRLKLDTVILHTK